MVFQHGKDTVLTLATVDISAYTNTSELTIAADDHDVTCYGADDHAYDGGLGNHSFTAAGIYDKTAVTGPRALLKPLVGTKVATVRRPEGTGSGLPQDAFTLLLTQYVETNPVADMIAWSIEGKVSGAVDGTAQA
jgi:hypothetical protein